MPATRQFVRLFILLMASFLLPDCTSSGDQPEDSEAPAYSGPTRFEKIDPKQSGISFFSELKEDNALNYLNFNYLYMGSPMGVADFNQDGLTDIYFVSTKGENKLYLNKGDFKFVDVTSSSGASAMQGIKTGVAIVDINQDGYPDIYQCRSSKNPSERGNLLFINNKDMTFTESAAAYGLQTECSSNSANFFDYDLAGDLDMYVVNHPDDFSGVASVRVIKVGDEFRRNPNVVNEFVSDRLYRNNGNGTFTNVSKQAGIQKQAFGLNVSINDINNDGYPDIYVCNDYVEPDNFYINNGDGTFTDRIEEYARHTCHFSMGSDFADFNNDGLQDLVVLDMNPAGNKRQKEMATAMEIGRYNSLVNYGYGHQFMRNTLQLNNGNGSFSEIGCLAGIANTDWSWAPLAADFDNDGFRDLFVSNGQRRDVTNLDYINFTLDSVAKSGKGFGDALAHLSKIPTTELHNYMFRNRGDLTFEDVSYQWGFGSKTISNSAVYADLDNDGDLDVVVSNANKPAFVYKNKTRESSEGNFLRIALEGTPQNRDGIGAKVMLIAGGKMQVADANPVRGFMSTSENTLHFGLGNAATIEKLQIQWPDGKIQALENVNPNQRLVLKYKDAQKMAPAIQPAAQPAIFANISSSIGTAWVHKENKYLDFDRERLLPHKFSDNGPCVATADVNGDGLEDIYAGGAFLSTGALLIQDKSGRFRTITAPFAKDTVFEDTAALFFDADGDKDQDLYVGSGGNELPVGTPNYVDRLYINDGKGNFVVSESALPFESESAGAVAATDFDHDGDLDIFVGNRCVPGQYPNIPGSRILRNDGGQFREVTDLVAPGFAKAGMITDIIFCDLDTDGWAEMLVTGEWMPIEVFKNNQGIFVKSTEKYGLAGTQGWWNCVATADMDGDGDLDLVAGNTGLNTRYRASKEFPLKLFAKDFDGNGSVDPVMAFAEKGNYYPVPTRDLIIKQMPPLKKKFIRYGTYATATIEEVFSKDEMKGVQVYEANELQTCYFENQNGKFIAHALAPIAQLAPVQAIIIEDFDKNGSKDILIAGNDYGIEIETGRYDAGNGLLLLNNGKAAFTAVRQSGFWANKEVKDMQAIRLSNGKTGIVVANNNEALQLFLAL